MSKIAFITGITGQDGSYLAELLLAKGYIVHGMKRRNSILHTSRIDHIYEEPSIKDRHLFLHYGDLSDSANITQLITTIQPDEIYNLAAQSHVAVSFEIPEYTSNVDAIGTLRILEAVRSLGLKNKTKFYQASTSELYGKTTTPFQDENTPFRPQSPYGTAKLYSFWITKNYRDAYGIFACNGILFNHESPRRGETFVTRKIARGIKAILDNKQDYLMIGNLEAKRDWGYAPEFVEGMWRMLQTDKPQDYVLATGEVHSVREFIEEAFAYLDIQIKWDGKGLLEVGYDAKTSKVLVKIDERYYRPLEVDYLRGSYQKAKEELGWEPKVKFKELVQIMMQAELGIVNNIIPKSKTSILSI